MVRAALPVLLVLLGPSSAVAEAYVLQLESLTGSYFFGADLSSFHKSTTIDLGVTFEEVESIRLILSGSGSCPGDPCLRATDFRIFFTGINPPFDRPTYIPGLNVGPFGGGFSVSIDLPPTAGLEDGIGYIGIGLGLTSRDDPTVGPSAPGMVSEALLEVVGVSEPTRAVLGYAAIAAVIVCRRLTRRCS